MNNLYYGFRGDPGQRAPPQSIPSQPNSQTVLPSSKEPSAGQLGLSSASVFPPVSAINGSLRHANSTAATAAASTSAPAAAASMPFTTQQPWSSDLATATSSQAPLPTAATQAASAHHHSLGISQQQDATASAYQPTQSLRPSGLGLSSGRIQVPARQPQYDDVYHMMNKGGYPDTVSASNGPLPTHGDPILTGRLQQQSDLYARHAQVGSSGVFDPSEFPSLGNSNSISTNNATTNPNQLNPAVPGSSGFDNVNSSFKNSMPISLNGHPYSDLYIGAYSNPRAKAVDALTGAGPNTEFSMQSEDFPVLGGGANDGNANRSTGNANPSQVPAVLDSAPRNQSRVLGMDRPSASSDAYFNSTGPLGTARAQFAAGSTSHVSQSSLLSSSTAIPLSHSAPNLPKPKPLPQNYLRQEQPSTSRQILQSNDELAHMSSGRNLEGIPTVTTSPQGALDSSAQAANNPYLSYSSRDQRNIPSFAAPNGTNFDGNTTNRDVAKMTRETVAAFQGLGLDGRRAEYDHGSANANSSSLLAEAIDDTVNLPTGSRKSPPTESEHGEMTDIDRYGMRGLLKVLNQPQDKPSDLSLLALGVDLTQLGLDLNSNQPLHSTFESPWDDYRRLERSGQPSEEQKFKLPHCYKMDPPPLKASHFGRFQLETLFYIFYSVPKDLLQALAAVELHNRQWRYHKELKLWFTRAPGSEPSYDRGAAYIYFDITSWERRPFHDANMQFVQDLLSEEELHSIQIPPNMSSGA